jgi:hypothetical protein
LLDGRCGGPRGGQELDVPDDADRGAVGAVVGDPVAVVEPAVDGDKPALGKDAGGGSADS